MTGYWTLFGIGEHNYCDIAYNPYCENNCYAKCNENPAAYINSIANGYYTDDAVAYYPNLCAPSCGDRFSFLNDDCNFSCNDGYHHAQNDAGEWGCVSDYRVDELDCTEMPDQASNVVQVWDAGKKDWGKCYATGCYGEYFLKEIGTAKIGFTEKSYGTCLPNEINCTNTNQGFNSICKYSNNLYNQYDIYGTVTGKAIHNPALTNQDYDYSTCECAIKNINIGTSSTGSSLTTGKVDRNCKYNAAGTMLTNCVNTVTSCIGGYCEHTTGSCTAAGKGAYSPINDTQCHSCPDGLTTQIETATSESSCGTNLGDITFEDNTGTFKLNIGNQFISGKLEFK